MCGHHLPLGSDKAVVKRYFEALREIWTQTGY